MSSKTTDILIASAIYLVFILVLSFIVMIALGDISHGLNQPSVSISLLQTACLLVLIDIVISYFKERKHSNG